MTFIPNEGYVGHWFGSVGGADRASAETSLAGGELQLSPGLLEAWHQTSP